MCVHFAETGPPPEDRLKIEARNNLRYRSHPYKGTGLISTITDTNQGRDATIAMPLGSSDVRMLMSVERMCMPLRQWKRTTIQESSWIYCLLSMPILFPHHCSFPRHPVCNKGCSTMHTNRKCLFPKKGMLHCFTHGSMGSCPM